MRKIISLYSMFLMIACTNPSTDPGIGLKDSLVKLYLAKMDSGHGFHDTLQYDYQLLKAYVTDNDAFFQKMKEDYEKATRYLFPAPYDSCIRQPKLSDLGADEAYRFIHGQSFCEFSQNITISRTGDSIRLQFIEYKDRRLLNVDLPAQKIEPYCLVTNSFEKKLEKKLWDSLERRIEEAEYWGLKTRFPKMVLDGSRWEIHGYTDRPRGLEGQKTHAVLRTSPYDSHFRAIGLYLMQISGAPLKCYEGF